MRWNWLEEELSHPCITRKLLLSSSIIWTNKISCCWQKSYPSLIESTHDTIHHYAISLLYTSNNNGSFQSKSIPLPLGRLSLITFDKWPDQVKWVICRPWSKRSVRYGCKEDTLSFQKLKAQSQHNFLLQSYVKLFTWQNKMIQTVSI